MYSLLLTFLFSENDFNIEQLQHNYFPSQNACSKPGRILLSLLIYYKEYFYRDSNISTLILSHIISPICIPLLPV